MVAKAEVMGVSFQCGLIVQFGDIVLAGQAECVVKVLAGRVAPVHGVREKVDQAAEHSVVGVLTQGGVAPVNALRDGRIAGHAGLLATFAAVLNGPAKFRLVIVAAPTIGAEGDVSGGQHGHVENGARAGVVEKDADFDALLA